MIPVPVEVERSIKNVVASEKVKLEEEGEDEINLQFDRRCLVNLNLCYLPTLSLTNHLRWAIFRALFNLSLAPSFLDQ